MRVSFLIATAITATVLAFSCQPDKKSKTEEKPVTGAPEEEKVEETEAGTIAIKFDAATTPAASLGIVQNALMSVGVSAVGEVLSGTIALNTAGLHLTAPDPTKLCDGNGYPLAQAGETKKEASDTLSILDPSWAARHFYCLMNSGSSPETMIGSIIINKGVLCALEKVGALAEEKYGQEQTVTIQIDSNCFTKEFVQNMLAEDEDQEGQSLTEEVISAGEMESVVTVKKLTGDANWDLEVAISNEEDVSVYRFRNTAEILSGMRLDNFGTTEESGYTYSVTSAGSIRFENRLIGPDPSNDPDVRGFTGKKHIRILVEGKMNKDTLVYESIDRYEAISSDYHGDATLSTIKGDPTNGFFVHGKHCQGQGQDQGQACRTAESFTQTVSQCITKDQCKDNTGLIFDSAEKYKFALNDYTSENDAQDMGKFLSKATLPLKYEAVNFSDLP